MSTRESLYVFIMAGGVGSRLWPRSRTNTPKQFLDLVGPETMLQESFNRLLPIVPPERILVGVGSRYVEAVREQVPDLPPENIVVEPAGRGTGPAIGLGALHIHRRDPEAVMVVVTADHHIGNAERFRRVLLAAAEIAENRLLVTLGITPTFASTGYGYIRRGEKLDTINDFDIYRAIRFTEKPDTQMAQAFLDSGLYSWNSGMFIWKTEAILGEFAHQMPILHKQLETIREALGTDQATTVLEKVWEKVEKQTIDYGIMEHAREVAVIPAQFEWNDIGSWKTLMDLLQTDEKGNVLIGEHLALDTQNTLVYSPNKLVATVGLENMVIVETGDALLICPQDRAQDVRDVVNALRERKRDDLL